MEEEFKVKIEAKGNEIRELKSQKKSKDELQVYITELLELKKKYKEITGKEYGQKEQKIVKEKKENKKEGIIVNEEERQRKAKEKEEKKNKKKEEKKNKKKEYKAAANQNQTQGKSGEQDTKGTKGKTGGRVTATATVKGTTGPNAVGSTSTGTSTVTTEEIEKHPSKTKLGLLYYTKDNVPLLSYVILSFLERTNEIVHLDSTTWKKQVIPVYGNYAASLPVYVLQDGNVLYGDETIAKYLCRLYGALGFYGNGKIAVQSNDMEVSLTNVTNTPTLLINNVNLVAWSRIDSWMTISCELFSEGKKGIEKIKFLLQSINEYLSQRTYFYGYGCTLADFSIWKSLVSMNVTIDMIEKIGYVHVARWYQHINDLECCKNTKETLFSLPLGTFIKPTQSTSISSSSGSNQNTMDQTSMKGKAGKSVGSCPPLEGAVEGQVVTRFPPEASGYLHIGHVKACMLNDYYAKYYKGKLIVRFDDTNPSKEKLEFEENILKDLECLDIKPSRITWTSDYFPSIIQYAKKLIKDGKAYMDNTNQEKMREERMDGIDSVNREMPPAKSAELFDQLLQGKLKEEGYCLRAKIDMQAKNKTLRDPVIFRMNTTPHQRTGTKYCAYPTYDFACPIVDSTEGVTHALRTTEYNDRDEQYYWMLRTLGLRMVKIHSFARMNFIYTVLSKRKLQWFVDHGYVDGWYDPRFPTVQGVLRRGVQVEALREFILEQGASRRITDMEWDKFWTINKKAIDPVAGRYFVIDENKSVKLTITNFESSCLKNASNDGSCVINKIVPLHPKNADVGTKVMRLTKDLWIEGDDAEAMEEDEEITLMKHGNVIVKTIVRDPSTGKITHIMAEDNPTGDFKKTKKKITWLAVMNDLVEVELVEFDYLISKPKLEENENFEDFITPVTKASTFGIGEQNMRNLKKNTVIQLERRGYYRVDEVYISKEKRMVLFLVPDGRTKNMSSLSTKITKR